MRRVPRTYLAAVLSLGLLTAPAAAVEPLPKKFDVDSQILLRAYAQAFKAAMDGSCFVLLSMVEPEEIDWGAPGISDAGEDMARLHAAAKARWRMFAAIQMYDRALCVPFDPTKGFHAFDRWAQEISTTGVFAARAKLELAWRLWEGFGAPVDRDRAKTLIREAMLLFASSPDTLEAKNLGTHSILGNPLPDLATRYWSWVRENSKTREDLWRFTMALHEGALVGPDGDLLPRYPYAAALLFNDFPRYAEARYHLGLLAREGVLGPSRQESWYVSMSIAADCRYEPAVPHYTQHLLDKEHTFPGNPTTLLLPLLWRWHRMGEDKMDEIERVVREYGGEWYAGEELERGIAFRLLPPEACESLSSEWFSLWDHLNLDEVRNLNE
jgi:hypothetical protein